MTDQSPRSTDLDDRGRADILGHSKCCLAGCLRQAYGYCMLSETEFRFKFGLRLKFGLRR